MLSISAHQLRALQRASAGDLVRRIHAVLIEHDPETARDPNVEDRVADAVDFGLAAGVANEQHVAELAMLYVTAGMPPIKEHIPILTDESLTWERRLEAIFGIEAPHGTGRDE